MICKKIGVKKRKDSGPIKDPVLGWMAWHFNRMHRPNYFGFFARRINSSDAYYNEKWVTQLDLLHEYGFISDEEYNHVWDIAGITRFDPGEIFDILN